MVARRHAARGATGNGDAVDPSPPLSTQQPSTHACVRPGVAGQCTTTAIVPRSLSAKHGRRVWGIAQPRPHTPTGLAAGARGEGWGGGERGGATIASPSWAQKGRPSPSSTTPTPCHDKKGNYNRSTTPQRACGRSLNPPRTAPRLTSRNIGGALTLAEGGPTAGCVTLWAASGGNHGCSDGCSSPAARGAATASDSWQHRQRGADLPGRGRQAAPCSVGPASTPSHRDRTCAPHAGFLRPCARSNFMCARACVYVPMTVGGRLRGRRAV